MANELNDLSQDLLNLNKQSHPQQQKTAAYKEPLKESDSPSLKDEKTFRDLMGKPTQTKKIPPVKETLKDCFHFWLTDWKKVIEEPHFGTNLSAALTVAAVALPLNVALAIAAGLSASAGLIAGAVGGGFAALFGGSRYQVTGPAAALNTMVFAIVYQYGPGGAAIAALITGLVQLMLTMISAGNLVKYVPEAVLLGFTSGVGVKLLDSQMPKLFGVDWTFHHMLSDLAHPVWLHDVAWPAVVCGLFVAFLILACKSMPRIPAALIGIILATQIAYFLKWPIARVGELPPISFSFAWPELTVGAWFHLIQLALPLGLVAAAESVLSAQAIDRMSGDKHHSNLEIFGQGISNLFAGLAGGMTVSGVIVRSSVNVQSGAKNRLGALFHALFLLSSVLFLGAMIAHIPLAALAGLLCIIGFRLIEFSELFQLIKNKKIEAIGFLAALIGTISNNIVLGLTVGITLVLIGNRKKKMQTHSAKESENTPLDVAKTETFPPTDLVYHPADRGERWIEHLKEHASVPHSSYVHPNASVIGRVVLGRNVHVAAEASVRADEGTPFYIGDNTNVQDGVVIHALKKKWVLVKEEQWAVYIGSGVSLAHHALVHGPCYIGDNTFVGFKAIVHDSIVGSGCYIGMGAIIVGVQVPNDRYIPHGAVIDTKEKAQALPKVSPIHQNFNNDVVKVNKGLAEAYRELSYEKPNN